MLRVRCLQGLLSLIQDSVDCGENNQGQLSFLGEVDSNAPDPWVQGWLEKSNTVVLPSVTPEYRRMYSRCGGRGCLHGQTLRQMCCAHLIARLREEQDHSILCQWKRGNHLCWAHCKADFPSIMVTLAKVQGGGFGQFLKVREKLYLNPAASFQARSRCKQAKVLYLTSIYTFLEGNKVALQLSPDCKKAKCATSISVPVLVAGEKGKCLLSGRK